MTDRPFLVNSPPPALAVCVEHYDVLLLLKVSFYLSHKRLLPSNLLIEQYNHNPSVLFCQPKYENRQSSALSAPHQLILVLINFIACASAYARNYHIMRQK